MEWKYLSVLWHMGKKGIKRLREVVRMVRIKRIYYARPEYPPEIVLHRTAS